MSIINIENNSQLEELLNKSYVLLKFSADWCLPCKKIQPLFEKLSNENSHICFGYIDVDIARDVCDKYEVNAMPTFILLHNGEEITRMEGANQNKLYELTKLCENIN